MRSARPIARKSLPLSRVYRLLEPGPVVLLTTANKGRANVMTMSWHTMLEFMVAGRTLRLPSRAK